MFFPAAEWFAAFLLTLAVEVPIVALLLERWSPAGDRTRSLLRACALAAFANLASHPLVWFVFTQLLLVGTLKYTLAAEGWAVGIEAVFYAVAVPIGVRRATAISLTANLASFFVGRLLWQVFPDLLS